MTKGKTVNDMIEKLEDLENKVGSKCEVVFVTAGGVEYKIEDIYIHIIGNTTKIYIAGESRP